MAEGFFSTSSRDEADVDVPCGCRHTISNRSETWRGVLQFKMLQPGSDMCYFFTAHWLDPFYMGPPTQKGMGHVGKKKIDIL